MKRIVDPDSFNYRLGKNLARIRKYNGLTHEDMDDYGISRSYYGKVELGLYSISAEKLALIARAFGVPITSLFIDENNDILEY